MLKVNKYAGPPKNFATLSYLVGIEDDLERITYYAGRGYTG
jgi:hypothetical protein